MSLIVCVCVRSSARRGISAQLNAVGVGVGVARRCRWWSTSIVRVGTADDDTTAGGVADVEHDDDDVLVLVRDDDGDDDDDDGAGDAPARNSFAHIVVIHRTLHTRRTRLHAHDQQRTCTHTHTHDGAHKIHWAFWGWWWQRCAPSIAAAAAAAFGR